MKKIISILMAAIMAVTVFTVSLVPAMADDTNVSSPTASTAKNRRPKLMVNGQTNSTDISYSPEDGESRKITFTYHGEGTLTGWETNLEDLGLVEGVDYEITYNEDGSLTIEFISDEAYEYWHNGDVAIDAIVDYGTETTSGKATTTKKDDSSKSPSTGVSSAVVAGTVAAAGAGIAVLAAVKKRDAE